MSFGLKGEVGYCTTQRLKVTSILPNIPDSPEAFRRLADSFPGFCWIASIGRGRPLLKYASPAATPLWTWCREQLAGDIGRFPEIIHPEDRGKSAAAWHRLRRGEEVSGECRLAGPAGEVHLITVRPSPSTPKIPRPACWPALPGSRRLHNQPPGRGRPGLGGEGQRRLVGAVPGSHQFRLSPRSSPAWSWPILST